MGIINREVFVDLLVNSPVPRRDDYGMHYGVAPGQRSIRAELQAATGIEQHKLMGRIDRESAMQMYDQIRAYIGERGYLRGKYLRPWLIDPGLYGRLDRNEPWWGFEFETGWKDQEARKRAVYHTWDTWDNVAFDSEGEGSAVEITFAPQELSKYAAGEADAYKFAEFLANSKDTYNGGDARVGTHLNISHPQLVPQNLVQSVAGMNRTLAHLPLKDGKIDVRKLMFGRSALYGGFFNGQGGAAYTEGKLFRTTYDFEQFRTYLQTCDALTSALTALVNADPAQASVARPTPYVSNLYAVFKGAEEPVIKWSLKHGHHLDGSRGNNLINGALASDQFDEDKAAASPFARGYNPFD